MPLKYEISSQTYLHQFIDPLAYVFDESERITNNIKAEEKHVSLSNHLSHVERG